MEKPVAPPAVSELDPDCIPHSWDELTPDWVTRVIEPRHQGAKVSQVEVLMQDDGTNRRARLGLKYEKGTGPERLFLKAHAASHRVVHLRNGNLWNEARLFASNVPLPVDHPTVFKSVIDLLGLDFLLVMEDVTLRDADPRDALRPLTPDQAARGLASLAALHSLYWNLSAQSHPSLDWLLTWQATEGWQVGLRRNVPIGLERAGTALPRAIREMPGDAIVGRWARYVDTLATAPVTLTHGDAHIGNTYVLPNDEVGFLDWQVVRRGRWSQDVGYFLIGSLTPDDRRRHERELIEAYRQALDVPGAERPGREEAWREYCASTAYGLAIWLSTLGSEGWQSPEISLALSERFAAAYVELESDKAMR